MRLAAAKKDACGQLEIYSQAATAIMERYHSLLEQRQDIFPDYDRLFMRIENCTTLEALQRFRRARAIREQQFLDVYHQGAQICLPLVDGAFFRFDPAADFSKPQHLWHINDVLVRSFTYLLFQGRIAHVAGYIIAKSPLEPQMEQCAARVNIVSERIAIVHQILDRPFAWHVTRSSIFLGAVSGLFLPLFFGSAASLGIGCGVVCAFAYQLSRFILNAKIRTAQGVLEGTGISRTMGIFNDTRDVFEEYSRELNSLERSVVRIPEQIRENNRVIEEELTRFAQRNEERLGYHQ